MKIDTMELQQAIKNSKKIKGETFQQGITSTGYFVKQMTDGTQFGSKLEGREFKNVGMNVNTLSLIEKIKEYELNFLENIITTNKREIKFTGSEIVEIKENTYEEVISIEKEEFKTLMHTLQFVAQDACRPILKGISFKDDEVCSLDGYRLCLRKGNFKLDNNYVISSVMLKSALGLIDKRTKNIIIEFNKSECKITIDNNFIKSKLIEGTYINYKSLLSNDEFKTNVVIDKEILKDEMDFLLTQKDESNLVAMFIEDKDIIFKNNNENNSIKVNIEGTVTGENINIAFNGRYIKDSIKNHGDKIEFNFNSNLNPCIIRSSVINGLDMVLPVRLNR